MADPKEKVQENIEEQKTPRTYNQEWTEYVLNLLTEKEIKGGYPTVDGLRRVAELIYGDILVSHTDVIEIPTTKYEKCTACHHIELRRHSDNQIVSAKCCVDVRYNQTREPYNQYLFATACTRAEGKTLRIILKLQTITAEEIQGTEFESEDVPEMKITQGQILGLRKVCERININLNKMIQRYGQSFQKIEEVTYVIAVQMMIDASSYQNGTLSIPDDIRS